MMVTMKQRVPSFNLSGANIPSFIVVVTLVCTTLTFASDKSLRNRPSHGPLMTSHGPLQGPFNAILKDIGESIKREAGKSQCLNIFQNKVIFEFISILLSQWHEENYHAILTIKELFTIIVQAFTWYKNRCDILLCLKLIS